jgi:hypothetical protein
MKKHLLKINLCMLLCLFSFGLKSERIDSTVWTLIKNKKSPIEIAYSLPYEWQDPSTCGVGDVGKNWTFPLIVGMKLTAIKEALPLYFENAEPANPEDLNRALNLYAASGICFSSSWDGAWNPRYSDSTVYPKVMAQLKKPAVRQAIWSFIEPALSYQVKSMPLKFQGIVVITYENVAGYFKNYNVQKAKDWYKQDAETYAFSRKDYLGNTNPSRKISAMIERLMFKWKIIDYNGVVSWSAIIGNWLKKTLGPNYAKSKALWGK